MTRPTETTDPTRRRFLRTTGLLAGAVALGGFGPGSAVADASNAPGLPGRIYADDRLFATKDATDLPPPRGNNHHSFDVIYAFDGSAHQDQFPVAEAAPGERDFNGGRWAVTLVEWTTTPSLVTNDEDVQDLIMSGDLNVIAEGARYFECPVVPLSN